MLCGCVTKANRATKRTFVMTDTATKVITLLSAFAGRACLAAAVAIAALTQPLAPANAAPAEEQAPARASLDFNEEDATLYIDWSGPILAGMADYLRTRTQSRACELGTAYR